MSVSMKSTSSKVHSKLLEAILALESEHSPQIVLQRVVEFAAELTSAQYGALGIIGAGGGIQEFLTTGITQAERDAIGPLPKGLGLLGALIEDPRPLRLSSISHDPRSVGFPPNHPPMESFLGAPVLADGVALGNIYLTNKQGSDEFTLVDEEILRALAKQAGAAVENARLIESARERQRLLEELREISVAALRETSSADILEIVAASAKKLIECDGVSVTVPGEQSGTLIVAATKGHGEADRKGCVLPMDNSLFDQVVTSGRSALIEDLDNDPRGFKPLVQAPEAVSVIVAPLSARDQVFGTLAAWNLRGSPALNPNDLSVLENLGTQGALGLQYSRSQERLRTHAVLEDRERIARELHDGVIQALFAVGMSLEATTALIDDSRAKDRVSSAVNELDQVIRELRSYIFGLHTELGGASIAEALSTLASEFERNTGVVTVADIDPAAPRMLTGRSEQVVQLAREALSNVRRHARASTCRISLFSDGADLVLEIDDDGRGFDLSVASSGLGIRNMEQRAAKVGGEVEINAVPGGGTLVRVRLGNAAASG
ncbi:MAG: GAF domain-containing sensor histidine kinase [Actinomycetota bacterium]